MYDNGNKMHVVKVLKSIKKEKTNKGGDSDENKKRKQGNTNDRPLQWKVNSKQTQPRPHDWSGQVEKHTEYRKPCVFLSLPH